MHAHGVDWFFEPLSLLAVMASDKNRLGYVAFLVEHTDYNVKMPDQCTHASAVHLSCILNAHRDWLVEGVAVDKPNMQIGSERCIVCSRGLQ